jgi:hypothetical protein
MSILIRKDKSQFLKKLLDLRLHPSSKRAEENQKFIFKRCLKGLKKNLLKTKNCSKSKFNFENYFNEYYFKEASEKHKLSLSEFCAPKIQKKKILKNTRTINQSYIQNVTLSQKFLKDFIQYLEKNFVNEYVKVMEEKLASLVLKWESQFVKGLMKPSAIEAICKKIENCPKCKLPWNVKEVDHAIKFVFNILKSAEISN